MNKSNVRSKRSLGKDSPLSKRPKLDFHTRTNIYPKGRKYGSNESFKNCSGVLKEKVTASSLNENVEENPPTASDWDDDFSGDMLEKVCLIADLSQAMVNNQSLPTEFDKEKINFEMVESNKVNLKSKASVIAPESKNDNEILKQEIEKLKDKLKTKEGEVHILRSQLKQSEDAKQTVAIQNIKILEEIQKKCSEKISVTERELDSTKSKLLFRDLEYKNLSERCRQLEYNLSKCKMGEVINMTKPINMSQTFFQKHYKLVDSNQSCPIDSITGCSAVLQYPNEFSHEGKCLMKIICPEFFTLKCDTNACYNSQSEIAINRTGVDFDKVRKYKWSNLPKQKVFINDLYNLVSSLFTYNNFSHAKEMVQTIFESCCEILSHQKEVLLFLGEVQLYNASDEADQFLLENEAELKLITVKNLIDGAKLNEEESGIEGRRSLALIYSLMKTSRIALKLVKNNLYFIELFRNLTAAIGILRQPLRYSGILIGIALILEKVLEEKNLTKEFLAVINQTVEEIIFSRPKLDVLREVINVLAAGRYHLNFLDSLCKVEAVDSCTLYMDCKLKQAMFFTKNACPLKLLCMQLMGLANMPSSKSFRWEITSCIIKWLNSSMSTPDFRKIKWLPINSVLMQEERCFNVTECLLCLLTLCLKDFNLDFIYRETDDDAALEKGEIEKKIHCISIIAQGAVLLKRIFKVDSRLLHDNTYSLRFAVLLKSILPSKSDLCHNAHFKHMTSVHVEAISWITDLIESDFGNSEWHLKQNTSAMPDTDEFNALKINDSKTY